jgi:hypothetical protein
MMAKISRGEILTNRSLAKKSWLVWCIMLITTSVYIGSSIYSPAIGDAADYFGISEIVSVLGLSLFGTSPLFSMSKRCNCINERKEE